MSYSSFGTISILRNMRRSVEEFVQQNWLHKNLPPNQVIYALCDPRIHQVRYIGHTANVEKRYREHLRRRNDGSGVEKGEWIDELLRHNFLPVVIILERVEYVSLTQERERRWMFHYFQMRAPLLNFEVKLKHLITTIQSTDVDFLTVPLSSPIWKDLLTAYEKDRSKELEERRKARLRAENG